MVILGYHAAGARADEPGSHAAERPRAASSPGGAPLRERAPHRAPSARRAQPTTAKLRNPGIDARAGDRRPRRAPAASVPTPEHDRSPPHAPRTEPEERITAMQRKTPAALFPRAAPPAVTGP